jgi:hypothetical protein
MTPADRKSERTDWLETLFWVTFALAVTTNTVEAFGAPSGSWWSVVRYGLSGLFIVSAIAVAISKLADRRGRPRHGDAQSSG